ncbi:cysteine desulfurase [Prochlorococcus marinus XMU1414]|uniref:Cysteine desulfurase n=1 Tax=Prochlorococcus marinus XMU1424 TaxID=2774497 RepID=A0A9D9G416_PROMR|nr:cysteine desulfurase family protein [Prochlorococcus marinus]MBO8227469.1 cysteine desulfurase [Prochlorococcus marinus XMU1414]MBW3044983.1 IscS subfamily cysteine desulfurase [Prochlorococcus marinus str. MU1414]MCR8532752.1 cysteine desulfurase [Prochlorococcus marinus XMU1420]MCR8536423.1 cysteine desulfurase [Prochlorococcus marinus XMU1424]
MLSTPILLDYQSSTPCSKDVVDSMKPFWSEIFSNPASKSNLAGINASAILEASREKIEQNLFLKNKKVIFTSGATESNNLALLGFARNFYKKTGNYGHIITLKTEHKAVLEPLNQLKKEGFMVTEINPEKDGLISEEKFKKNIREDTFLVSVMLANNEIGVIQPVENISKICKSQGITFHSDFAQCLGYIELDNLLSDVNMITMSSHKIYGPKGIGLLLIDETMNLEPLIVGGGQEYGLRSGTLPLPLVVGFAKAIEIAVFNQKNNAEKLLLHRNTLLEGLLENNSGLLINGSIEKRLPHNLNLTVLDLNGAKFHKLLKSKIICSSGSACSNGEPSHVLLALGRSFKEAEASIRLSIGLSTNSKDIKKAIHILTNTIRSLR